MYRFVCTVHVFSHINCGGEMGAAARRVCYGYFEAVVNGRSGRLADASDASVTFVLAAAVFGHERSCLR